MRRFRIPLIILAIIVALLLSYALQPSKTPPPQPALVTLSSADFAGSFYGALNARPGDARLILLVSPT